MNRDIVLEVMSRWVRVSSNRFSSRCLYFALFFFLSSTALAQLDTARQFKDKLTKADSSTLLINKKIDSVQLEVNKLLNPNLNVRNLSRKVRLDKRRARKDSVQFVKQVEAEKQIVKKKIDSLEQAGQPIEKYTLQLDSLNKVTYQNKTNSYSDKLKSGKQHLFHQTDSLKHLSSNSRAKLDSITGVPFEQVKKAQSKIDGLERRINAPGDKVEGAVNEKLSLMSKEGGTGANIPTNANIPNMGSVDTKLNLNQPNPNIDDPFREVDAQLEEKMSGVTEVKGQLNEVKNLPQEQINKVKSIDQVKGVTNEFGKVNSLTDKAQGYTGDVKNIAQGNLNEVKEIPKTLESQVTKLDELQGFQKETGQFTQYSKMTSETAAQQELKKEAMEQMTNTVSIDHFAGKEEVLKAAIDKMSKLKLKYPTATTLRDITKRVMNEMNGKPLIERLLPGITLQFQKTNNFIIDYNPFLAFRISGKLNAGAGWNERVTVGKHFQFSLADRVYGPRIFGDLKIGKGLSFRTDIEKLNTYIPSAAASGLNGDPAHRAWVWSVFIGIKKEYQFFGNVRGNAQFLYNLYDDHYNSPYTDRFAIRTGFEFPMKKQKKKLNSATPVKQQ